MTRLKAIVVDDDPLVRSLVSGVLARRGYEVVSYSDPVFSPQYESASCPCPAAKLCPDVIITDLEMPYVNGLDFIECQRRKGCRCRHVALMSDGCSKADLQRGAQLGVAFITKPFHPQQFCAWLDEIEQRTAAAPGHGAGDAARGPSETKGGARATPARSKGQEHNADRKQR